MIEYRIMGVPGRSENIEILKKELDISDDSVFLDTEYRKNPMWTWKQTVLKKDVTGSHICIIQDDAVLCDNFKEFCEFLVKGYPTAIYTLFNNRNFDNYPYGSIIQHGTITGGVAILLPREYVYQIIESHNSDCPDYPHDDEFICYWSHRHDVKVLTTYPCVVNTLNATSILGHNYDMAKYFISDPLSIKDWKWKTRSKWTNRDFSSLSDKTKLPKRKENTCINGKEKFYQILEQFNNTLTNKSERQKLLPLLVSSIGNYSDIIPPLIADYQTINLHIGNSVYVHPNCMVQGIGDIYISDKVKIGCGVSFITSKHGISLEERDLVINEPIRIEKNVWLGANVTILGGVTIGAGSIIGAGSVVTKDIPPMVLAVGNPCKPIRNI